MKSTNFPEEPEKITDRKPRRFRGRQDAVDVVNKLFVAIVYDVVRHASRRLPAAGISVRVRRNDNRGAYSSF